MSLTSTAIVPWQQLHGRKSFYRLHPAMLEDEGYLRDLHIRPVPYTQYKEKADHTVKFDRKYAISKLAYEIEHCAEMPFLDLVEILAEAYVVVNLDAPIIGIMSEITKAVNEVVSLDPLSLSGSW